MVPANPTYISSILPPLFLLATIALSMLLERKSRIILVTATISILVASCLSVINNPIILRIITPGVSSFDLIVNYLNEHKAQANTPIAVPC